MEDGSSVLLQLVIIAVLTLLNAFFAAAEIALVSLNKNRISRMASEGNKKAELLVKLIEDPSKFIATIQVGITLAGFFSSASAATGLSNQFAVVLGNIPYAQQISVIVITILLSYFMLVFGELYPKRVALQNAEKIAMFAVKPILWISKIATPFVKLLSFSTNLLIKLTKMGGNEQDDTVSREEIWMLAQAGQAAGTIAVEEMKMLKGVFQLDNKVAREIMTPRTSTFALDVATAPALLADILIDENYSRVPIYEGDIDSIIGILHMRDFFAEARQVGFDKVDIRSIMREAYFVPETKFTDDLLKELQALQHHMAVLIDEYGGFAGLVTIEDLIEEIVGEIDDEYDESRGEIIRIDDHTYLAYGTMLIEDFNEMFKTKLEAVSNDTIAGFILERIGTIPSENDHISVEHEHIQFTVEEIVDNRLNRIRIALNPQPESQETRED